MKRVFLLLAAVLLFPAFAADWDMGKVTVVMPKKAHPKYQLVKEELEFHLKHVAGTYAPGNEFKMFIGQAPKGAPKAKKGDAWCVIDGKNIYFYGDEGSKRRPYHGSLMAVYTFFRKYYGLRYLRPGNEWITGKKGAKLTLPEKETIHFKTKLELLSLRTYGTARITGVNGFAPKELHTSQQRAEEIIAAEKLWRLRNRIVTRHTFDFGHAFRAWQKRFLKTHPEYFGLSPYGTRGLPMHQAHLVKLCLSNDAVIDQIIADWVKGGKKPYLNLCPNDGTPGYCFCEGCRKLDADLPGERFHSHKTDRYLNFWNRVTARAREIRPDVTVVTYIYSYYRFPPRREKIQFPDNTLCGLVHSMTEDIPTIYKAWQDAGMKRCFFRPNFLHYSGVLPRGLDGVFYRTFQEAAKFDFIGADYDAIPNRRPSDLDFYLIARLMDDPSLKYETILDEYFGAYYEAAPVVRKYYARIRERGEKALQATARKMTDQKLSVLDDGELDKYSVFGHTEKDLIEDMEVLKAALKEKLSPVAGARVKELLVNAEHYLHTFRFMRAGASGKDLEKYAKILTEFRIANKNVLNENFGIIYSRQELKYWKLTDFYNKTVRKNNFSAADPCAGWRASFDDPGLAGWLPRNGYVKVTDATASFDKYSVEAVPKSEKSDTIVIWKRAVPVTPGKKYSLKYDFKFQNVPHGGIRIVANNKARARLLRSVVKNNGKGFWINKTAEFTVPADCGSVDIYVFIGKKTADDAKAYLDNIVLTRQ